MIQRDITKVFKHRQEMRREERAGEKKTDLIKNRQNATHSFFPRAAQNESLSHVRDCSHYWKQRCKASLLDKSPSAC